MQQHLGQERSRNSHTHGSTSGLPRDHDSEKTLSSSVSSINPTLSTKPEIEYKILQQQNSIMEKLVTQQQRSTLPHRDMFTFDGDLTKYRTFIRAFETLIEAKEPDYASKLYYLEQYTSARAQELVRSCMHMLGAEVRAEA